MPPIDSMTRQFFASKLIFFFYQLSGYFDSPTTWDMVSYIILVITSVPATFCTTMSKHIIFLTLYFMIILHFCQCQCLLFTIVLSCQFIRNIIRSHMLGDQKYGFLGTSFASLLFLSASTNVLLSIVNMPSDSRLQLQTHHYQTKCMNSFQTLDLLQTF